MKGTFKLLACIAICSAIVSVPKAHERGSPTKVLLIDDHHEALAFAGSAIKFLSLDAYMPVEQPQPLVNEFRWQDKPVKVYEYGTAGYFISAANRNLKATENIKTASAGGMPYWRC